MFVHDETFARHLGQQIERLMQQRCERIRLPTPGPLRSAWIALRSLLVFHAMRFFSGWARHSPDSVPRVVPLQVNSE